MCVCVFVEGETCRFATNPFLDSFAPNMFECDFFSL